MIQLKTYLRIQEDQQSNIKEDWATNVAFSMFTSQYADDERRTSYNGQSVITITHLEHKLSTF